MTKRKPVARKLLLALAMLANAISFNAVAQGSGGKVCNFKVTYDGSTQSLDVSSDPMEGTTLNIGDRFLLDIHAAGSGFFESKTDSSSTEIFASLYVEGCGTRTGNVTTRLLLDGTVVSQATTLGIKQSCVHFGAQSAPPLTVGLRFDQILVDYEFLASTSSTNVLQGGGARVPVQFERFTDSALFAFHQGSGPTADDAGTNSSNCLQFSSEVLATGLNFPFGVAVGSNGVYIADHNNHRVWKIANPLIPVAGAELTDAPDVQYNGDGIDATLALLDGPSGVAVDGNGNVFIADSGNHIIRKVTTGGIISTVAGTPTDNSLGLEGALLDVGNDGPATSAVLNGPRGIAVDAAGNLYIVDTMHQQVRKVDFATGKITVVAGVAGVTGANDGPVVCPDPPVECDPAKLNDPRGVAVDSAGNVYIADAGNDKVRKVAGGVVTTVAAGALDGPTGVAVAADGTLYIADHNNNRIQRVSGATVTTVPVSGLKAPNGIALDPATGDLYIADTHNHRIVKVDFTP